MTGEMTKLLHGDWADVMKGFSGCDVLCTDPPYSARNHEGQRTGSSTAAPTIDYSSLTNPQAIELAEFFAPLVRHWVLIFCDHTAFRWHEKAWRDQGWYTFAPVPWIKTNAPPRMLGDGPQTSAEYILVARPKHRLAPDRVGSRRGYYMCKAKDPDQREKIPVMKYLPAVVDLLEDYTIEGDLVVDPYAGTATTLAAAAIVGCYGLGCEMDGDTAEIARRRLSRGYTPKLLTPKRRVRHKPDQLVWVAKPEPLATDCQDR